MKYTLYYSVRNGGDGSAYPTFMESEELAQWDQDHMSEGWGESCDGSISFETDSPVKFEEKVETKEKYLVQLISDESEDLEEFIAKFFPDGMPTFRVVTRETGNKDYLYNDVYLGDILIRSKFVSKNKSGKVFENLINRLE